VELNSQRSNLADPLARNSYAACAAKKSSIFYQNRSFSTQSARSGRLL